MCVFIWFVGRNGTPTSAPRWGQTGGRRVRVSSPHLRSAGPLQRSKIIRNYTPFLAPLRTFSFILLTVFTFCPPPFCLRPNSCLLYHGAIISSHFSFLLNLIVTWNWAANTCCYHLNLIPCGHSSSLYWAVRVQAAYFWLHFFFFGGGDVSEQTGFGSPSQCTWWCSEFPINLRDICGGK